MHERVNDRCSSWDSQHCDSELGLQLVNLVNRHGLSQIINEPTRITDQTASLLDLIITDVPNDIIQTGTLSPVGTSDHAVVICKLNLNTRAPQMYTREVWNFQQADWSGLNTALTMAPFDVAFQLYNDIDDIVHYWVNLVKQMLKEFIPCHIVRVRPKDTPWVTNQLRALIRK